MTRRRALKTLFCSSVLMDLNVSAFAKETASSGALDLLAVGDFGMANDAQRNVARAMARYARAMIRKPDGLLFLGDNFYGKMPGGLKSKRWMDGYSNMYRAQDFPGPCWPILGNHDYHDHPGGEQLQLRYAASLNRRTRWTMPSKYYRLDLPVEKPKVTILMLDTNWESINRRLHGEPCWMDEMERVAQMKWVKEQLESERAAITIVAGHHPVYSEGGHGDTQELIAELGPLLQKYGVHLYIGGHDHDLQHLELENLRTSFVISGGGGASLHHGKEGRQGSTVLDVHGFTHLSLVDQSLTVRHIDQTGKVVHAFAKSANHNWKLLGG